MSEFNDIQKSVVRFINRVRSERKKKMQDFFTSVVRTYVPFLVGVIASWLVSLGIDVGPEIEMQLGAFLTFAFGAIYYIVVRLLAKKFPKLEWLLGSPKKPEYNEPK